jgi:hypothetical protein
LVEHKLNRKDIKVVVSADSDLILNRSKIHKWDLKGIDGEQIPRPIQSKQFYHMETATHLSPRLLDLARSNADYVFHLPDPVHLLTQYGHNKSWIDLLKSRKSLWESKLQILIAEKKISNDSLTKFKVTLSAANKMIKALEENRSHDIISSFIKSDRVNKEDIIENWYLGGWHLLLGALITAGLPETTNIYRPLSRRDSDYIDLFSIDPYVNGMTIYHAQSKETISTTELIKNFPFMELVRKKVSYYNNN